MAPHIRRFLTVLSFLCGSVASDCPHSTPGLLLWSDSNTWNGNIPGENAAVTIDRPILLDTQPPPLYSIQITPTGVLVWDPDAEPIHLKVHWIDVEGELHIGAEDCRFTNQARITFMGNVADMDEFGKDKGLYVREDGVLEIHGKEKFSWTKLTQTANKAEYSYAKTIRSGVAPAVTSGLIAFAFDPTTGALIAENFYNTDQKAKLFRQEVENMKSFTDSLPDNTIIGIAVVEKLIRNKRIDRTELKTFIAELGYGDPNHSTPVADEVTSVDLSYVFLTQKGDYESTFESWLDDDREVLYTEAFKIYGNIRVKLSCYIDKKGPDNVKILVSTYDLGPILNFMDDVSSWEIGDEVVIVSTDYDWRQAEVRQIVECSGCNTNQIRLNDSLDYTHYGEIYQSVDMRGEVALLTRNIKFDSEDAEESDEYGGHIRILKGFKSARIQGAEFENLGASQALGRYSLHLHMCHDVYGRQIFRQNSIHHANTRCITIHGTHNATISENVCYLTKGHGYFMEDGGERDTYFYGNIGLGQERGFLIPTDVSPSTFWITNPYTVMVDNVAAGSDKFGFWYIYPDSPMGPSAGLGFMMELEARYSVVTKLSNNVAHSNDDTGLQMDNRMTENGTQEQYNKWRPKENPIDFILYKNSSNTPAIVEYFTAYKNRITNVWIRVGELILRHVSLSDSLIGTGLIRMDSSMEPLFEKSIIVGSSDNLGEPFIMQNGEVFERSVPNPSEPERPQIGWMVLKRSTPVNSIWFGDFQNTELFEMSALGFKLNFKMANAPFHRISKLQFGFDDPTEGNRLLNFLPGHVYYSTKEAEVTRAFIDVDGSTLDKNETSTLIYPLPFHLTPACIMRTSWNMSYCPHAYGTVDMILSKEFRGSDFDEENDNAETGVIVDNNNNTLIMTRDEDPDGLWMEHSFAEKFPFLVILGGSISYTMRFTSLFPSDEAGFWTRGITKSNYVRVGLCIPRNTTFTLKKRFTGQSRTTISMTVSKLEDLDKDEVGDKYFHDDEVGYMAVLLRHEYDFEPDDVDMCVQDKCLSFEITPDLSRADPTDVNCLTRLYDKYGKENIVPKNRPAIVPAENNIDDRLLYHTSRTPPSTWGAGPSRTPTGQKRIWILILIASASYLVCTVIQELENFYSYPTFTTVDVKSHSELEFPAITVCNLQSLSARRIDNDERTANYYVATGAFEVAYLAKEINWNDPFYRRKRFFKARSKEDIMLENKKHFIRLARFNRYTGLLNNFSSKLTPNGICYTTDPGKTLIASQPGSSSNLLLWLYIDKDDSFYGRWLSEGIKFFVHDRNEDPYFQGSSGYYVSPGQDVYASIKRTQYHYLSPPYQALQKQFCRKNEKDGTKYIYSNCVKECYANFLLRKCNCLDFEYKNHTICSKYQFLTCVKQARVIFEVKTQSLVYCDCPPTCDSTQYEVVMSSALYLSDIYKEFLEEQSGRTFVRSNYVFLHIYFDKLETTLVKQIPQYSSAVEIFGNLGGQMGLFLGASILTLTELAEFLIFVGWYAIHRICQTGSTGHKTTPVQHRDATQGSDDLYIIDIDNSRI